MKKKIISFLLLLILGITFFSGCNSKNINDINTKEHNNTQTNMENKTQTETITNCQDMDCFEKKFTECQNATVTLKLNDNVVYFYEIIGLKNEFCQVKSEFLANPNPKWVGKKMTCQYDNSKKFEIAIKNMSKCSGILYNLMMGDSINDNHSSIPNNKYISNLSLTLNLSKDSYKVGESMEGTLQGKGLSHETVIFQVSRNNQSYASVIVRPAYDLIVNNVTIRQNQDFEFNIPSMYITGIPPNTYRVWRVDSFRLEGKYNYSFFVYDCDEILNKSGMSCLVDAQSIYVHKHRIHYNIEPLQVVSKIITVKGKVDSFSAECINNEECAANMVCGGRLSGKENICVEKH